MDLCDMVTWKKGFITLFCLLSSFKQTAFRSIVSQFLSLLCPNYGYWSFIYVFWLGSDFGCLFYNVDIHNGENDCMTIGLRGIMWGRVVMCVQRWWLVRNFVWQWKILNRSAKIMTFIINYVSYMRILGNYTRFTVRLVRILVLKFMIVDTWKSIELQLCNQSCCL